MELDQVFGYFWHLQTEIFHVKKIRQNIQFRKSYEQNKLFFRESFQKKSGIFHIFTPKSDRSFKKFIFTHITNLTARARINRRAGSKK